MIYKCAYGETVRNALCDAVVRVAFGIMVGAIETVGTEIKNAVINGMYN